MAEGRNTTGRVDVNRVRWWQEGSTQKKPTYFTKKAAQSFWAKQEPLADVAKGYFAFQQKLIKDRNVWYKAYDPKAPVAGANFEEAMRLAGYGYTGVFGRSETKKTLGLIGEDWQQAYALNRIRRNKEMLAFTLLSSEGGTLADKNITLKEIQDNPAIKDYVAADILVPGSKRYNAYTSLYDRFIDKYGIDGAKYAQQEGHMPFKGSTYGILYNTNNKKDRKDDVDATYQHTLARTIMGVAKGLIEEGTKREDAGMARIGYDYIRRHEKDLIPTSRTKPKAGEIKELETTLRDYIKYSALVAAEISGQEDAEAVSSYDRNDKGAIGSVGYDPLTKAASKAMDYVNGLAESDFLAPRETFWNPFTKDVPTSQRGVLGFIGNLARGGARMGAASPTGIGMILDEAYFATKETVNWATNDKYDWGESVDFQMGDALWAGLAASYYDPFAKDAKGEDRPFWEGLTKDTSGSFDRLGEQINRDPFVYALDALSLVPVVGWAAKAASIPTTIGKMGVRAAEKGAWKSSSPELRAEWKASKKVISDTEWASRGTKELQDSYDNVLVERFKAEKSGKKGSKALDDAEQRAMATRFEFAPSGRTFRKTTRNAWNNPEGKSAQELSRWKALGYEFNGQDTGFGVRSTALFEHRTKVMTKPFNHLDSNPDAIYRMPASPIMRGLKEGFFWVGRGLDKKAAEMSTADTYTGRVATKLLDFPLFSYSYNYTKAIRNTLNNEWGDVNREFQRAAKILEIENAADLTPSMRTAIQMKWAGGEGDMPTNHPMIRRQHIQTQIDSYDLSRTEAGKYSPGAAKTVLMLKKQLDDLLKEDVKGLKTAKAFDDAADADLADIRGRIENATYKADDANLDKAMDIVNRLEQQNHRMSTRIAHANTTLRNLEHLKLIYHEAMQGLGLSAARLFGNGRGDLGSLGIYVDKVLVVKTTLLMADLARASKLDRQGILDLAQHPTHTGNIFQGIKDAPTRKRLEDNMIDAFTALQRRGAFTDAKGAYGSPGRPVLVLAANEAPDGFVAFRIPTLRHTKDVDTGIVSTGKIVDKGETFILPKVFFDSENQGKGKPLLQHKVDGKESLYVGALNAMSDVYPKARFYSEKFDDKGLRGTRMNEQQIANRHTVAESALRMHALSRIIVSQAHHYKNRVERDLRTRVDSVTIIMDAADVSGKTSQESGVHILKNVGAFDNYGDAHQFAIDRRVEAEFLAKMNAFNNNNPDGSNLDVQTGMGIRDVNGERTFFVRGDHHDWLYESGKEKLAESSLARDFIKEGFMNIDEIPATGKVLAITNNNYDKLVENLLVSDEVALKILSNTAVKGFGSIFKFAVLNLNPAFITTNIIGGLAMMMLYNPAAASRILASVIQGVARKTIEKGINNDKFTHQLTTFKNDSDAMSRVQAYENTHNIYRQDAGLMGSLEKDSFKRKYAFYGGYTVVSAWEEMMRRNIGMDFARNDAGFQSFMRGPEVAAYIKEGKDWHGNIRGAEERITPFEAAVDLMFDPTSKYYDANLLHSMRYVTNTVSGNYHQFNKFERAMRDVVSPFYAWQRHSATFSYRMFVDKPIATNAMYELGAQGYQQNSEQGVPDWMMSTVPVPAVIKDLFDIKSDDFRLDGTALSPYGTTGQMGMAAIKFLTGAPSKQNILGFANPYLLAVLQDTLGVNMKTGAIDWERYADKSGQSGGLPGMFAKAGAGMFKATGPYKLAELAKYREYEVDSTANKYAAIENAPDIMSNYDPENPDKDWDLKIPNMTINEMENPAQRVLTAAGLKNYRLNPSVLPLSARVDAVGAIALKHLVADSRYDLDKKAMSTSENWIRKREWVHKLWAPYKRSQGMPESEILAIFAKMEDERPKKGIARDLTRGVGNLSEKSFSSSEGMPASFGFGNSDGLTKKQRTAKDYERWARTHIDS